MDGVAPAVLKAPGVDRLVLGQIFNLVGGKVPVTGGAHGGVGGKGNAPLRVDIGGQGGPVLLLKAAVNGAGGAQQGEIVLRVQGGGGGGGAGAAVRRLGAVGGRDEVVVQHRGRFLSAQVDGQQNAGQQPDNQGQDAGEN